MQPFQNEAEELEIGDLKIENRLDRVTIYGRLDLTRDKAGLENARALKELFVSVVSELEADPALPARVAPPKDPVMKKNPFV
jgi:hypothetical protein